MKNIIYFISFLSLLSCGAGVGDESQDLGNGYFYIREGSCRRISANNIFKDNIYPNVKEFAFDNFFM